LLMIRPPPSPTLSPYPTLFRSGRNLDSEESLAFARRLLAAVSEQIFDTGNGTFSCTLSIGISTINEASTSADGCLENCLAAIAEDRKSTRLNSSHVKISYAVFC